MCVNEKIFGGRFFVPKLLCRHTTLTQRLYARQVFVYKDKSALIHKEVPALTTIIILVYDLVRVNLVTRAFARHALTPSVPLWQAEKKIEPTLRSQKNTNWHDSITTAKPSCRKPRTRRRLPADQAKLATGKKRGISERLWISHLISTG
ncbi:hypothetical protein [Janthinobacterium psychrotolerans]|uniref:hypothetical protein n=1 Tax=Janthinobacterium psychrotolerans TaxID=1747903 RepID=UPI00123726B4|nr:hypothetical protein [Janthinobacterium psychrotolerans]